ncbi:PAS domain-containing sensor histidine kinase [Lacinutrix sp. Hel_I_90]|uniref:PAS domain-containing sensor histidine kinase n=1 Tax=Lacinutrix sp. Hel_I_90 TaxID=1249999 RepID=UPI0005C9C74A|nr:PAS domain-containing sensor histidine kinase [Lacinutrix sp. Hel_I_90]
MKSKNASVKHNRIDDFETLKWQFALENFNVGVWHWDNTTNEDIVSYSKESKFILGYLDDDNTFGTNSQDWNDRVHKDDKEKYFQDFQDHLNGLCPIYQNKHRVLCNDGSYKWIQDKGKIIERDSNGVPVRVIGTHTDITELVEKETKINNTLSLITGQNNKLKNFAHIVTHNLKEHSGNFKSLLNFYRETDNDSEKKEIMTVLDVLSDSLSNTILNLTKIVSVESKDKITTENIFLKRYIEQGIRLLDMDIKEHQAIINNRVDAHLSISFNPAYLESIIQNLLSNAIKYRHPERKPIITITSRETTDFSILNIEDNGLGIDLEKYGSDIFGLYRTFHHNENAEGVGLYLTKSQMEAFGGKIEVSSTVNVGATFTLFFAKDLTPFSR